MPNRAGSLMRVVLVAAQAGTVIFTWPLWQPRTSPPELPVVSMPGMPFGAFLLATLALVLLRPTAGVLLHGLVLGLAVLADQTREQAPVLAMAVLLVATLPWSPAQRFGVAQLAATWGWAGLGKLTSPRAWDEVGGFVLGLAADDPSAGSAARAVTVALGAFELGLAVLALRARTRRFAAWLGCALHLGILGLLSPLGRDWNPAVWPWNAALAAASLLLLRHHDAVPPSLAPPQSRGFVLAAGVLFLGLPAGFHLGFVDAPLAQQVYTGNTCRALVLRHEGRSETVSLEAGLGVMLPPVPRIFLVWFRHHGGPGDRMILIDDRPLASLWGPRELLVRREDLR